MLRGKKTDSLCDPQVPWLIMTLFDGVLLMRWLRLCLWGFVLVLSACGAGGNPAPAPSGLSVVPGDTEVSINWNAEPGVEYWILYAPAAKVDEKSWSATAGGNAVVKVQPPYTLTGLVNGVQYAFAVNARVNGGPGGPASPSMAVTPRQAGEAWTAITPVGSSALRASTYGLLSTGSGYRMVVAGDGGVVHASTDGTTWTTASLAGGKAVLGMTFASGKAVLVGEGGSIHTSTDLSTFTAVSSGVGADLHAVVSNGSKILAVGAGGVILSSTDTQTWSSVSSGVTKDLYSLVYSLDGYWLAAGADGTVLKSPDGTSWTSVSTGAPYSWLSLTTLPQTTTTNNVTTTRYRLVAVGDRGQVATSTDGETWTRADQTAQANLRKVVGSGSRFLAMADAGTILLSSNGTDWQTLAPVTSADLLTVVRFGNVYRAFGAGGVQLESR